MTTSDDRTGAADVGAAISAADRRGPWLLIALLLLSLAAFGFTRALRAEDDVVNSVEVSERIEPGERAAIRFETTEPDGSVDVLVIDRGGELIRTLQADAPLPAGRHAFSWDGSTDGGGRAAPGTYRLRIVLGDADRNVEPPGPIELIGGSG